MKKIFYLLGLVLISACSTSQLVDQPTQIVITQTKVQGTPTPDAYATNWANLVSALTAQSDALTALPTTTPLPVTPLQPILQTLEAQSTEVHSTMEALSNSNNALAQENQNLQAEIDRLNAQINSGQSQPSQSGNSNSPYSGQKWPDGVTDVVFVELSHAWKPVGENGNGRPIMEVHQPRVEFPAAAVLQVYTDRIQADGGSIFYEIFDPDGVVSVVLYVRDTDLRFIDPNSNRPYDVIDVKAVQETRLYYVTGHGGDGRPIIQAVFPKIAIGLNVYVDVYVEPIWADGGTYYLKVYDPNRKYSQEVYIPLDHITFKK